jgi:hypothetical protein
MNDMTQVIQPRSDQLNSDSLQAGPITIKITAVSIKPGEQPVTVSYAGDDGKPWKPCKSMARVMVAGWGPDAAKYVGKSLTLFRDPAVTWGGMAVGGIRISHMSDLDGALTLALTATRGNKKPFKVLPLRVEKPAAPAAPDFDFETFEFRITAELDATTDAAELATWWETMKPDRLKARDADKTRAGQSASRVSEKLAELTNSD